MELISVFTDPSFLSECLQCPGILITARFFDYFDWTSHLERDIHPKMDAMYLLSILNENFPKNCIIRQIEGRAGVERTCETSNSKTGSLAMRWRI